MQTESSTHTIVVKESLCEDDDDEFESTSSHNYANQTHQFEQTVVFKADEDETSSYNRKGSVMPEAYEEMIQKLEKDIRQHIAFENQMRIHIENLTGKTEEHESIMNQQELIYSEEVASLKREKRRLDDLLTIREDEIMTFKKANAEMSKCQESMKEDFNLQLQKIESKYDKQLSRIREDFLKSSHHHG